MTREEIIQNKFNQHGANLREADLRCADLSEADLSGADLRCADLSEANLRGANLRCADLSEANLRGADLRWADLRGANLRYADLRGAKNIPLLVQSVTSICPEGTLRVYKKTCSGVTVLEIPSHAFRSNATGRKCRASEAIVVETPNHQPDSSGWDVSFEYKEGATVKPHEFDPDRWNECAGGIHFFLTREEAENYG